MRGAPAGAQAGWPSLSPQAVSWRGGRVLPGRVGRSHSWVEVLLLSIELRVTLQTACWPSGESAGWPMRSRDHRSSTLRVGRGFVMPAVSPKRNKL